MSNENPHFSTAFHRWAESLEESLYAVATTSGVNKASLYRIRAGEKAATPDIIAKLLPAVEAHDSREAADRLLIAWVRDILPPAFAEDLSITLADPQTHTADLLDEALTYLRRRAERDPDYAEALITQYLTTRHSDLQTVSDLISAWHKEAGKTQSKAPVSYRTIPTPPAMRLAEEPPLRE